MKVVPLGKAKNELSTYVDEAQGDRVLITRHGRPAAVLIGVEGESIEDVLTAADDDFWAMIEHRRKKSRTVSAAEMRRRLGVGGSTKARGRRAG
jgi:prevent-host-death family protein